MAEEEKAVNATPRFLIRGQYIKDLSFENPHAPNAVVKPDDKPEVNVDISLKAQRLDEQHFELVLKAVAGAKTKATTIFMAELDYAAVVQLINIPEERMEQILFIDCAAVLFPFARRILSDVTRDGGFMPLMLEPIDFLALYARNKANEAKQAQETKAG